MDNVPYGAFWGKRQNLPSVAHLKTFGCRAYVHVQKDQRQTFESKTREAVFIGYPAEGRGWKFWDPTNDEVWLSKDAIFDEKLFPAFDIDQPAPEYDVTETDEDDDSPESVGDKGNSDSDDEDFPPPPPQPLPRTTLRRPRPQPRNLPKSR